jgi:hypothetical protein
MTELRDIVGQKNVSVTESSLLFLYNTAVLDMKQKKRKLNKLTLVLM